ncbi:hypothetical protein MTP99_017155 [Tenebrio molitor]|nr:hypothetical protein MTP99_017155 [Tenebrio molitor]
MIVAKMATMYENLCGNCVDKGSSYSSKPCGWCAVSSPCGKFERTLPTPLREDFGPNAKARDAIEVDSCEAFPLPEGNPPSPPPRL